MKIAPFILVPIIFFGFSGLMLYAGHEIFGQSDNTKNSASISFSKIFKDVQGSAVQITRENKLPTGSPGDENVPSLGSGFVCDKEGRILAKQHGVAGPLKLDVPFIDGNRY